MEKGMQRAAMIMNSSCSQITMIENEYVMRPILDIFMRRKRHPEKTERHAANYRYRHAAKSRRPQYRKMMAQKGVQATGTFRAIKTH